jgi:hypothetical protein
MRKITLFLGILISTSIFGQKTFVFDSIAVLDGNDTIKIEAKTHIKYSLGSFMLISEDKRVYSYLLPTIEFTNPQYIEFYDTGTLLADSTSTIPVAIYQSEFKKIQVAQYIKNGGVLFMKRNNTGIKFY